MRQQIDAIDISDEEAAALDAHVDRLRAAGETDLTAAALLARMTHKVVRGWSDQVVEHTTSQQLREIETKLRAVPPSDRGAVMTQIVEAIDSATS